MTEKQKSFIHEYFSRTERGRAMIKSNSVSDSELLFMIPNNVKKMHGLPLTRMTGKKKRKKKNQKKRQILSFNLFDLIEDIIEKTIVSAWSQNDYFDKFVDSKYFNMGDKHKFAFDESNIVVVPTSAKPIKLCFED